MGKVEEGCQLHPELTLEECDKTPRGGGRLFCGGLGGGAAGSLEDPAEGGRLTTGGGVPSWGPSAPEWGEKGVVRLQDSGLALFGKRVCIAM